MGSPEPKHEICESERNFTTKNQTRSERFGKATLVIVASSYITSKVRLLDLCINLQWAGFSHCPPSQQLYRAEPCSERTGTPSNKERLSESFCHNDASTRETPEHALLSHDK